ncbi:MAG: type III secretion T3S chaperone, partial [Rhabdochlamydiaceae bacterium]
MSKQQYPLDQLAQIKQKRLEEAEKILREKKEVLAREQEKLTQLEKKRDEVKAHYKAKLTQLREKLDAGTSSTKITQMKQYLKIVVEDLTLEEKKVAAQSQVVETAEKQVEEARQELFKKQKDVEKLKLHHKEWKKEMHLIEERREGNEGDEMGSTMHHLKKTAKKRQT